MRAGGSTQYWLPVVDSYCSMIIASGHSAAREKPQEPDVSRFSGQYLLFSTIPPAAPCGRGTHAAMAWRWVPVSRSRSLIDPQLETKQRHSKSMCDSRYTRRMPNSNRKRLGVIVAGDPDQITLNRFGDYGQQTQNYLNLEHVRWTRFHAVSGVLPDPKSNWDGFVITGSAAASYGSQPWIGRLKSWIEKTVACDLPLVGFCFGHQVIAEALGGRCEPNPKGWELGLTHLSAVNAFDPLWPVPLTLLQMHQDHVKRLPRDAQCILRSVNTDVQLFRIGRKILGIQGHPEFHSDVIRNLLNARVASGSIDAGAAQTARDSLSGPQNREFWRELISATLLGSSV